MHHFRENYQQGQALLILIFISGIVMLFLAMTYSSVGTRKVQDVKNEITGKQALAAAQSGIEEILYRLGTDTNFGNGSKATISSTLLNSSSYIATISGDSSQRIATSTGIYNSSLRKIQINLIASPSAGNVVLSFAVQTGVGGITMSNNSSIAGSAGADGNVYTNGSITGNNSAKVKGNLWAVQGVNPSGGDLTITKNVYASTLKDCKVTGDTYSPVAPVNCTVSGQKNTQPAPSPVNMPSIDIAYWEAQAAAGGTYNGNYTLSGSSASLGPQKIIGDVTLSNSAILTVTGTLWVLGNFTMSNSSILKISDSFNDEGTVIVLDKPTDLYNKGRLAINNSAAVQRTSQGGYILFVTTNTNSTCSPASAAFNNNSAATAILAPNGCVTIGNSGGLVALAANRLDVQNGAQITYDTGLSSELYLPGPGIGNSGSFGWAIGNWKEIP